MNKFLYVILMENKFKLNAEVVERHVRHLENLDQSGNLILCGPFTDYSGGIIILNASSFEQAKLWRKKTPLLRKAIKLTQSEHLNTPIKITTICCNSSLDIYYEINLTLI